MEFEFTGHRLKGRERKTQRFLEILPGLTSWSILTGTLFLSVTNPIAAALFFIAFNFYWLLRLLYMTLFLVLSYYRLATEQDTDWMSRVEGIDRLDSYLKTLDKKDPKTTLLKRLPFSIHKKEVLRLRESRKLPPLSKDIYHLVILPIVKESREILEPGIHSLSQQQFPSQRIIVVLALEERAEPKIKDGVLALEKKYKDRFMDTMTVLHPSDIPTEARVKGANTTYAAKRAAQYLLDRRIPFENVIVSCFDSDTVVNERYFSCLTYYFMVNPARLQSSFQPIPVYHNNIWEAPGFARVIEAGSSFFLLAEATNPEKLVTFSSHSMSFKALTDVGFWPVDMISDDSAIFWKSYIHYDGQYRVIPMYVTLSMDVVTADNFFKTIKSVYKQKRRWAWGVENFPIVMRAFLKCKKIPVWDRGRHAFKLFEGHISWATWGFLLSLIGWLPIIFVQKEFSNSAASYNVPFITGIIFNLASFSLLISIILSVALLPKRKEKHSFFRKIKYALEWLLFPFILLFLSALPALDAQTRLMLGKYMEFWVTDKKRKSVTN